MADEIKITASAVAQTGQTSNEETWEYQKKYDSGNCLTVNAVIKNKNITGAPVITVQENPFKSGKQIQNISKAFCKDAMIYEKIGPTKSQIKQEIVTYEKKLNDLQNGVDDGASYEILGGYNKNKSLKEQIQASIDKFKEQYNSAPEDSDMDEATYQLNTKEDGSYQSNMEAVKSGKVFYLDFVNWDANRDISPGSSFILEDSEDDKDSSATDSFVPPAFLSDDEKFTKEKEVTDKYVQAMGIDYMSLQSVCRRDDGYDYYYTRTVKDFPETYADTYLGTQTISSEGVIVNKLWTAESLHIVSRNGEVVFVEWKNPSKIVSVDNENVQTKSWDEIQKIFLKQADYLLSPEPHNSENGTNSTVFAKVTGMVINRIEFGLTKIIIKNSNTYKLIPTWSFLGYDSNYVQKGVNTGAQICFITINAIDGSIIDRGVMY